MNNPPNTYSRPASQSRWIFSPRLTRCSVFLSHLLVLAGSFVLPAHAFKVVPMKITLAPQGREANGVFNVVNDGDETLAIDVRFATREVDEAGNETNVDASDQFMVFPPQFALKPQKVQTVRIRWIGKEPVKKELPFRLIVEQLPVKLNRENQGNVQLNMALRYLASVYVRPANASASVSLAVESFEAEGQSKLGVIFENTGTRHTMLSDLAIQVDSQGQQQTLSPETLQSIEGTNLLAGSRRRFVLDWPAGLPVGKPKAKFQLGKR